MSMDRNPATQRARRRAQVRALLLLLVLVAAYTAAVAGATILWGWGGFLLVAGGLVFLLLTMADLL